MSMILSCQQSWSIKVRHWWLGCTLMLSKKDRWNPRVEVTSWVFPFCRSVVPRNLFWLYATYPRSCGLAVVFRIDPKYWARTPDITPPCVPCAAWVLTSWITEHLRRCWFGVTSQTATKSSEATHYHHGCGHDAWQIPKRIMQKISENMNISELCRTLGWCSSIPMHSNSCWSSNMLKIYAWIRATNWKGF